MKSRLTPAICIFWMIQPWLLAGLLVTLLRWLAPGTWLSDDPLRLLLLGAALTLAFSVWMGLHLARGLGQLAQAGRALAQGRVEQRAPSDLPAPLAAVALHLNQIARAMSQTQDHHNQLMQQSTTRLKSEHARLQSLNSDMRAALLHTQSAAESQSALFANLSHELRTPLTGILGYADLLRRSALDPEQEQYLETLDRSARGLLAMVNDLLDWSRIESGRLHLNEERFDIHEVVENVTTLLAPLAYQKDLELVRIVDHDVPRGLSGDAQRLRQILTNLLSNAIKFTDVGEVVVRVTQGNPSERHVWLNLSVQDTGVGISPAVQARLFQPFQQAGHSQGGSGLGLSISRRLAEMMGGEITLESALGKGAHFCARLPFRAAARADDPGPDGRMRGRRVWLFEPHPTARLALTHWLSFWGVDVVDFDTPQHLAERLEIAQGLPSLVIVGLAPQQVESLRAVLQHCGDRKPPLLALVASASLDLQLRLRALGAAACLAKSVDHQALLQVLVDLSTQTASPRPLARRRALIADNNLSNLRYLALLAVELGLDVLEAHDGEQALALYREHRVEFVLLDARMPRLDGPGCARAIRAVAEHGAQPRIIAVSAHLEPDERRAFLDAGADQILLKPFDERQLLHALRPTPARHGTPSSRLLGTDPDMLALLREELPLQLAELEAACAAASLETAREAAHQLRGTAAFYHLGTLRDATHQLETRLRAVSHTGHAQAECEAVQQAIASALTEIDSRLAELGG